MSRSHTTHGRDVASKPFYPAATVVVTLSVVLTLSFARYVVRTVSRHRLAPAILDTDCLREDVWG